MLQEEIENAVKTVCNRMPIDLKEQCDDYVDAYGDQVIALLQQEIDPSVVSAETGDGRSECFKAVSFVFSVINICWYEAGGFLKFKQPCYKHM